MTVSSWIVKTDYFLFYLTVFVAILLFKTASLLTRPVFIRNFCPVLFQKYMFWHPWESLPTSGNKCQEISIGTCPFANIRQQKPLKIVFWFCITFPVIFSSNNEECHQLKSSGHYVLPVSGSVYYTMEHLLRVCRCPNSFAAASARRRDITQYTKNNWPYEAGTYYFLNRSVHRSAHVDAKSEAGKLPSFPCMLSCLTGSDQGWSVLMLCLMVLAANTPSPWECTAVPRRKLPWDLVFLCKLKGRSCVSLPRHTALQGLHTV